MRGAGCGSCAPSEEIERAAETARRARSVLPGERRARPEIYKKRHKSQVACADEERHNDAHCPRYSLSQANLLSKVPACPYY